MGELSVEQVKFVQTLADLSYGTGRGEGANGGKGNMGLFYGADGTMHVVKCNTHFSQAENLQKAIDKGRILDDKHKGIVDASNNLRSELVKIARTAGMSNEAIEKSLGGIDQPKKLLTRKIVAGFVTTLKGVVEQKAREGNPQKSGRLDGVWKNVRATKSAISMSFKSVQASGVEGHNATVLTVKQMKMCEVRDLFSVQAQKEFGHCKYPAFKDLAQCVEKTLELSLKGEKVPDEDFDLATNYKAKFQKCGLAWMLEDDERLYYEDTRDALRKKFAGLDCEPLQKRVIDYNFDQGRGLLSWGNTLNQNLVAMLRKGETYADFLKSCSENVGTGAFFNGEPPIEQVQNAIEAEGFRKLDGPLQKGIARGVWKKIVNGHSDPLREMLDKGSPKFSKIVNDAFWDIKKPFSDEEDGVPLESIRNALGDRVADLDEQQSYLVAQKIWKNGLSEKFGGQFKTMMLTGSPTFADLVNDVAGTDADLEKLKQSGSSVWDELECCLTVNTHLSEEMKKSVRNTLFSIKELGEKKDDIIAGIQEEFQEVQKRCENAQEPAPDWKKFLGNDYILLGIFGRCRVKNDWAWHVAANDTDTLLSMFESFANFPALYATAKEKGAVAGLLVALTETGCAQARLDTLQSFMATLDGSADLSPVKYEPNDTPQSAIKREVAYAAQAVRAEKKIADKDPIAFSLVEERLKNTIKGKVCGDFFWSKHNVYVHLGTEGRDEVAKLYNIEFGAEENENFEAVLTGAHLGVWN